MGMSNGVFIFNGKHPRWIIRVLLSIWQKFENIDSIAVGVVHKALEDVVQSVPEQSYSPPLVFRPLKQLWEATHNCFRDGKHYAALNDCQSTDLRKLEFHRNASFASVNIAKVACKELGIPFSISSCMSIIHNAYMLNRFICVSGLRPNPQVLTNFSKNWFYLLPGPLRPWKN